jgi:hypothetical protein
MSQPPHRQIPELAADEDLNSLAHFLGYRQMDSVRDLQLVLQRQSSMPSAAEQEAKSLWQSGEFLQWLYSRESDILFVTTSSAVEGRTSALSVVCATMALQLLDEEYHPNLCIQFFCGKHTKPDDPLHGPRGMICCLISQLAIHLHTHQQLRLSPRIRQQVRSPNEGVGLDELVGMFHELLAQLPLDSTLFCILDGVSMHQYQGNHLLHVLSGLKNSAPDCNASARLKILLTGPTRYEELVRSLGLQRRQCVRLNRTAARGDFLTLPSWSSRPVRRHSGTL